MEYFKSKVINYKSLLVPVLLILSIGERVLFDLGPNIELITVSVLLASAYLSRKDALWIVLTSMAISDVILGNTNIFIFTWTGFLIPTLFVSIYLNKSKLNPAKLVGKSTLFGVETILFFFIWTNFGVWILDSWGMYSNDLNGLMQSYINALPFLKMQILSNLVIIPAGFTVVESFKYFVKIISSKLALSPQPQS